MRRNKGESNADYGRRRREDAIARGLCALCLKRPARSGLLSCKECRDKAYAKRKQLIGQGRCHCGRLSIPGVVRCQYCRDRGVVYWKQNKKRLSAILRVTSRQRAAEKKRRLNELKSKPCVDCGGTFHPICMDFDHRDPSTKTAAVSQLVKRAKWERVEAEIAKCDLVCANCHRLRSLNQVESFRPLFSAGGRRAGQLSVIRARKRRRSIQDAQLLLPVALATLR